MANPAVDRDPAQDRLTDEELAKFCEFFYRKTGILFEKSKRYFIERRLIERMIATEARDFREYFAHVRFEADQQEVQFLVNTMTVNETYFFREDYQFKALTQGILPDVVSRKSTSSAVRLWSMPCSTGEEPYSIAIHLLENWAQADSYDIEIHASDIDSSVLDAARRGVYGTRSLHRLPQPLVRRYFDHIAQDEFRILGSLRQSIDFSLGNIVDRVFTRRFRGFDVIFCRNLLIYFDDASRRDAIEALYDCLAPGGFICLGHSESMSRISSLFRPRKFADTIVYQKPLEEGP